jgi:hypothetical protein
MHLKAPTIMAAEKASDTILSRKSLTLIEMTASTRTAF